MSMFESGRDDGRLRQVSLARVKSWPETMYFARKTEMGLPSLHSLHEEVAVLAFESKSAFDAWRDDGGSVSIDWTVTKTNIDCSALLHLLKEGGATVVWVNPTARPSVAMIHDIDELIQFLDKPTSRKPTPAE